MNYQPVPIHSNNQTRDFVLMPFLACTNFKNLVKEQLASQLIRDLTDYYRSNFKKAADILGVNQSEVTNLFDMYQINGQMKANEAE